MTPQRAIDPRDATRGGVNWPALPAQRGRERPLWIDAAFARTHREREAALEGLAP